MTTAFDQVKVDAKCLVQTCEKRGCSVDLRDLPKPFRLIDMDHPASPTKNKGTRCDYLFIGVGKPKADDLRIVPLELKSTSSMRKMYPSNSQGERKRRREWCRADSVDLYQS